jgi:hypothetical protein
VRECIDPQLSHVLLEISTIACSPVEEMVQAGTRGLRTTGNKYKPQAVEAEVLIEATDPLNGDKRILVTLSRGWASQLRQLRLVCVPWAGATPFDAWIPWPQPGLAPAGFLLPLYAK